MYFISVSHTYISPIVMVTNRFLDKYFWIQPCYIFISKWVFFYYELQTLTFLWVVSSYSFTFTLFKYQISSEWVCKFLSYRLAIPIWDKVDYTGIFLVSLMQDSKFLKGRDHVHFDHCCILSTSQGACNINIC